MSEKSIVFDNVSFSYDGKTNIVNNLSFSVESGSFVSIIGDNGSGKTTIAKLICSILEPVSGEVRTNGYAGLIFQNPVNQMVGLTVEEEVAFGPENLGLDREEIRNRVDKALKDVGLSGLEKELVSNLSGGQAQALAIAGILAMNSSIIVCDESLSMLDNPSKKRVMTLLKNLCKKGKTVVFITNDIDETDGSDKVLEL